jgi:hypothetical protein
VGRYESLRNTYLRSGVRPYVNDFANIRVQSPIMSRSDINDTRRHVQVLPERVGSVSPQSSNPPHRKETLQLVLIRSQVTGTEFPHHHPGEDHSWNLKKFTDVRYPRYTWQSLPGWTRTSLSQCRSSQCPLSNLT